MEQVIASLEQILTYGQQLIPIGTAIVLFVSGGMFITGEQNRQKAKGFLIGGGIGVLLMAGATTLGNEFLKMVNF